MIHMRTLTYLLDKLQTGDVIPLGFVGENEHTRIIFDASTFFAEYPRAVPAMTVRPPKGDPYPAVVTKENGTVYWDVTDSDLAYQGMGKLQLSFVLDEMVAKTWIITTRIQPSLQPTGDIPEPIDDWLTRAEAALAAIPESIEDEIADAKAEIAGMRDDAEAAKTAAETAQGKAEDAQTGAETAKRDAVDAKAQAVLAKERAVRAEETASNAMLAAQSARDLAAQWATGGTSGTPGATNNAKYYSEQAGTSASNASLDADRAEQAANTAGFMEISVDGSGHLIYLRTDQVDADLSLDADGHLILESA